MKIGPSQPQTIGKTNGPRTKASDSNATPAGSANNSTESTGQTTGAVPEQQSLSTQVISSLKGVKQQNTEQFRKQLIVQSLSKAMGNKATSEPDFGRLVAQIDETLAKDPEYTQKLNQLKDKLE